MYHEDLEEGGGGVVEAVGWGVGMAQRAKGGSKRGGRRSTPRRWAGTHETGVLGGGAFQESCLPGLPTTAAMARLGHTRARKGLTACPGVPGGCLNGVQSGPLALEPTPSKSSCSRAPRPPHLQRPPKGCETAAQGFSRSPAPPPLLLLFHHASSVGLSSLGPLAAPPGPCPPRAFSPLGRPIFKPGQQNGTPPPPCMSPTPTTLCAPML